jgi:hypothetical protein
MSRILLTQASRHVWSRLTFDVRCSEMTLLFTLFGVIVFIFGAVRCRIGSEGYNSHLLSPVIFWYSCVGAFISGVFIFCMFLLADAWSKSDDPQIHPFIDWGADIYRYLWWMSFSVVLYFILKDKIPNK